jgi:hypothetical protein
MSQTLSFFVIGKDKIFQHVKPTMIKVANSSAYKVWKGAHKKGKVKENYFQLVTHHNETKGHVLLPQPTKLLVILFIEKKAWNTLI